MFKFALALVVLMFSLTVSAEGEKEMTDHNSVINHYCKTGVPAITVGIIVEDESILTIACTPKVGQFVLIIICDIDECAVEEDRELPADGFERIMRSTEREPGLDT